MKLEPVAVVKHDSPQTTIYTWLKSIPHCYAVVKPNFDDDRWGYVYNHVRSCHRIYIATEKVEHRIKTIDEYRNHVQLTIEGLTSYSFTCSCELLENKKVGMVLCLTIQFEKIVLTSFTKTVIQEFVKAIQE